MTGIEVGLGAFGSALASAAPYVAAASAAVGAISQISAGQQRAEIDERNARVARANAAQTLNAGEADTARAQQLARRQVAQQENAFAGSGVDPASGSPLDVLATTAQTGALDSSILRWRALTKANAYLDQADTSTLQAGQDSTAGYLGAGSTILTAGARYGIATQRLPAAR